MVAVLQYAYTTEYKVSGSEKNHFKNDNILHRVTGCTVLNCRYQKNSITLNLFLSVMGRSSPFIACSE